MGVHLRDTVFWVVVSPQGIPVCRSFSHKRSYSKKLFCRLVRDEWDYYFNLGYRCLKVEVIRFSKDVSDGQAEE